MAKDFELLKQVPESSFQTIFLPEPIYWDIKFVLKCLPAHCDTFRIWASHNCLFWTPTKLSQWIMHFVPIFLSDHGFLRRTSQKLSLWWVDLLSVILNLTNNALDDIRVNFFGRQLIGRKTSYSGQKNDFFCAGLLSGRRNNWAKLEELSRAPWLNVPSPPLAGSLNEPCLRKKGSFKRGAICAMKRWQKIFCRSWLKIENIFSSLNKNTACVIISRNDEQDVKHETFFTRLNLLEIQINKF